MAHVKRPSVPKQLYCPANHELMNHNGSPVCYSKSQGTARRPTVAPKMKGNTHYSKWLNGANSHSAKVDVNSLSTLSQHAKVIPKIEPALKFYAKNSELTPEQASARAKKVRQARRARRSEGH